jgi:hypothetical protein
MKRNVLTLTMLAGLLLWQVPAWAEITISGGSDLDGQIAPYLLKPCDLPAGYCFGAITKDDRPHASGLRIIGSAKKKYGTLSCEVQRIEWSSGPTNAYVIVCKNEDVRDDVDGFLQCNAANWGYTVFPVKEALILVYSREKTVMDEMRRFYVSRHAMSEMDRVEKILAEKNGDKAAYELRRINRLKPVTHAVGLRLGDLYLTFSPPRGEPSVEAFACVISAGPNEHILWQAHLGRSRAYEMQGMLTRAQADASSALEFAQALGLRVKARTLFALARIDAKLKDSQSCEKSLQEALRIETMFGAKEIADKARQDDGIRKALGSKKLDPMLAPFATIKRPEAVTDPEVGLRLSRQRILALPVVVRRGGNRAKDLELTLDAALRRKVGRKGASFGKKRVLLARAGLDEASADLCTHAEGLVLGVGGFDLELYEGGRHGLPALLVKLMLKGKKYCILDQSPDLVLAVSVTVTPGAKKSSIQVHASLFDPARKRVLVFLDYGFTCSNRSVAGKMKDLARKVYSKLQKAVR